VARIREDHYGIFREKTENQEFNLLNRYANLEISAYAVEEDAYVVGRNLIEIQFRKRFSVTVVGILRQGELLDHPEPETTFETGDTVYIMGRSENVARTFDLFSKNVPEPVAE
jgi:K+/H+ antiporter YhaU regulatory subunit KhtT